MSKTDQDGDPPVCELGFDCSDCMAAASSLFEPDWHPEWKIVTWIEYMDWLSGTTFSILTTFLFGLLILWYPAALRTTECIWQTVAPIWRKMLPKVFRRAPQVAPGVLAPAPPQTPALRSVFALKKAFRACYYLEH